MLRMLDHVVLVVRDLAEASAEHARRGFTVTPGGEHADGLTHNALVAFADGSYLELIAFRDLDRARDHPWHRYGATGGLADFALLSDDVDADAAALVDLVVRKPTDGGRVRPDGVRLAWRSTRLVHPLPFLIQDVTPRALRVPSGAAARHANAVTGIETVVVGARDPAAFEQRYASLRARGAPPVEVRAADADDPVEIRFKTGAQ